MKAEEFENLVAQALDELPKVIQEKMDNVAITVEKGSLRGPYLGFYEGVPKNTWGRGFGMVLPDKITIFQLPMESMARSREELKEIVKDTVWHEIAHHFGFNEKMVRDLEKKRKRKKLNSSLGG